MSDFIYGPGGIGKTFVPPPPPIIVSSWDDCKKAIKILGTNSNRTFILACDTWADYHKIINKITKENN